MYVNRLVACTGGRDRHHNESYKIIQYDIADNTVSLLNTTNGTNGTFPNGTIYHDGQASVQIGNKIYGVRKGHDREIFVFDLETLKMEDPIPLPHTVLHNQSCITYCEYRNIMYIVGNGFALYMNVTTKQFGSFASLIYDADVE